jgi:hypothetical protein
MNVATIKPVRCSYPIGSMYGIYANIWGILMVNVTIYSIHGSYGYIFNARGKELVFQWYLQSHLHWDSMANMCLCV